MTEKENKIAEFQEILFWQDLNRQTLLLEKDKKKHLKIDHDKLQIFCFQNNLFKEISKNALIDNIPLVLTTDFKDTFSLDIQLKGWNDLIKKLLLGMSHLDIESALINQFEKISLYDEKYKFFPDTLVKDDEELYDFIHQYNEMREEYYGSDISDIILSLHGLKTAALETILSEATSDLLPTIVDKILSLDIENHKDREKIQSSYTRLFCKKAIKLFSSIRDSSKVTFFKDSKILGFLIDREHDKNSIKKFKKYEYAVITTEIDLIENFIKALNTYIYSQPFTLKIKNITPFSFLHNPFPIV